MVFWCLIHGILEWFSLVLIWFCIDSTKYDAMMVWVWTDFSMILNTSGPGSGRVLGLGKPLARFQRGVGMGSEWFWYCFEKMLDLGLALKSIQYGFGTAWVLFRYGFGIGLAWFLALSEFENGFGVASVQFSNGFGMHAIWSLNVLERICHGIQRFWLDFGMVSE
jgi:hypothetical protein